jgi:ribosomal protein S27E
MSAKEEFEQMKRDLAEIKGSKTDHETEHTHSRSRVNCPSCHKTVEVCKNCGNVVAEEKPLFLPDQDLDDDQDSDDDEEEED